LDRDYSGLRGYDQMGRPNSQVGQFGLNPTGYTNPLLADPINNPNTQRQSNQPPNLDNLVPQLPPDMQGGGLNLGRRPGTGQKFADEMPTSGRSSFKSYEGAPKGGVSNSGGLNTINSQSESTGENDGSTNSFNYWNDLVETITNPYNEPVDPSEYSESNPPEYYDNTILKNDPTGTTTTAEETSTVDPKDIFNPNDLTPFQAYDRQRFAAPGQNTLRGEGILAGRYNQRFGPGGTDPFAAATTAVNKAAGYGSTYKGLMDSESTLAKSGGYQTGLGTATDPNIFQSGDYTSDLTKYTNPNKDLANVNKNLTSTKFSNANKNLTSTKFSNANADLTGAKDYKKDFKDLVNQSTNLYEDQVVNQTISDLNRARQMTQNQIGGQAAKAGAFGGSRQALLEAENNRNYLDRVAAATGQLRQQGFESAANRAQQENLQRLGLTASDTQNVRGLQSQGNLAAQGLTARDAQDVRGLQSQGGLAAQGLTARDAQDVRGLQSQGGLAAQGLESQGALAALGANAGLYQSALGLNAAGDRSAMGYNAGLLSDAMGLDAADLNQRRNLASNEAQFAETANRGAGALNLQGGQALGQLAQAGTADERQRIADILAAGGAGDARNQQDLDFIFNEFNRELAYPGQQIDLRNAAISPATGSIVTSTQPRYQQNPILGGLGGALTTYGITSNPYLAGAAGLLSYQNS